MATLTKVGHLAVDMDAIRAFAEKHRLQEFSIFGSALRDDFRPDSDVDILFEPLDKESMSIEKLLEMIEELEKMFYRKIDLVQRSCVRNPFRRHSILTSRRKLYVHG